MDMFFSNSKLVASKPSKQRVSKPVSAKHVNVKSAKSARKPIIIHTAKGVSTPVSTPVSKPVSKPVSTVSSTGKVVINKQWIFKK